MKGGFLHSMIQHGLQQSMAGKSPLDLSVVGKGFLTPQTASIAGNFMKQNPGAVSAVSGGLKEMAPAVKKIITQLIPLIRQLLTIVIKQLPFPTNKMAMGFMETGLTVLPRIISMALENPQQAFQTFMKLSAAAASAGVRLV
jgi:hypothetical protein